MTSILSETRADPSLEARVNAQRKLLIALMTFLAGLPDGKAFLEGFLEEQQVPVDQEEDPGIVPDQAYAIQQATADEIVAVLEASLARARAASSGR